MFALLFIAAALCSLQGDWAKFKVRYGKSYSSSEEDNRKAIFSDNLRYINLLNKIDSSATYGITKFADLSSEEFAQRHLGYKPLGNYTADVCDMPEEQDVQNAPSSYDWRDHGVVNEVADQGSCGSCWAFATTAATESAWAIAGNGLLKLSEQQIVDCDMGNAGCDGGNMYPAETYIQENGLTTEDAYPYAGVQQYCQPFQPVAFIHHHCIVHDKYADYAYIEKEMMYILSTYGPLVVGINANKAQLYNGGIIDETNCNPRGVDHAVLAVAYDTTGETPYWVIRNSWGSDWGEEGYFRMVLGKNACGVATDVTYVVTDSQ